MQETQVWSLGQKDPLEEEMATYSSFLAWRIPWTEAPSGLQSMGSQRVRHSWAINTHTHHHHLCSVWWSLKALSCHWISCQAARHHRPDLQLETKRVPLVWGHLGDETWGVTQSPFSREINVPLGKAVLPSFDHQMAPDIQLCLPPWGRTSLPLSRLGFEIWWCCH